VKETLVNLCELCQKDELTPGERIEHLAQLLEDSGKLQGLQIVHGRGSGSRLYAERGGRLHLTESDLEG